jgi:hypothetical protein
MATVDPFLLLLFLLLLYFFFLLTKDFCEWDCSLVVDKLLSCRHISLDF